jgi:hypothetical protein
MEIDGVIWHEGDSVIWDEGMLLYRGYIDEINEPQGIVFLAVSEVKVMEPTVRIPMTTKQINHSLTRVE